jgi:N-formylglutamate amidohydrolase
VIIIPGMTGTTQFTEPMTLAARSYLKHVPGARDKVSQYFSMAGPHHGTTSAVAWCQNLHPSCKPFAIGSPWLADLNSGTEVPGAPAVRYTTLRSTCDTNVDPSITAELAGGGTTTATTTSTPGQPPYTEKTTGTAVDHYVAKRVGTNHYVTLGSRYGYTTPFPLYSCTNGWTEKADCTAI